MALAWAAAAVLRGAKTAINLPTHGNHESNHSYSEQGREGGCLRPLGMGGRPLRIGGWGARPLNVHLGVTSSANSRVTCILD